MYSDVCISDFDSDNDDIAWSFQRPSNNDYLNESISTGSNSSSTFTYDSRSERVREFGEFEENYGWIQCRSKSYPDRMYYHNTHSGCGTWYRPISRCVDIPLVSIDAPSKVCHIDDTTVNDLELMSVSDHEKESDVSAVKHNGNGSLIEAPDIITRYYYTPQVDLTSNMDNINDSYESINALNKCGNKKKKIDLNKNNISNDIDDSETEVELLCATNFLETEFFVEESEVLIKSPPRISVAYGVPCVKKLNFEDQLIKRRTCISKDQESGKIICDMYGVRTINYNLSEPDQKPNEVGIKSSRLSESDSDTSELSSSSQPLKTIRLFESEWRDIEKNLHQPLLSDPSSSPSSRSDTSSSSTSQSTSSASSCSTCCSCDKEA
ncbi:uncharacterized protein [Linepithema humile]|uniref:uncharacterized protein n=1 Tax=Linepithema humile TaxID=83485 RepID=UPI00062398EC|nr:PREDICTED: uncharacterized protein LOC105669073 [Linepithema humile]